MSQYKTGVVSFTGGSANVSGVGTLFLSNVSNGDWISLQGQGNAIYFVLSVTDDENLVLTTTYAGADASGQAYWTFNYFTSPDNLPILSENDVDTHRIMSRLSIELQTIISDLKSNEVSKFTDEVNQILTSSAIVDVLIYDTTQDSDLGNWRFLKKSWYSESTPSGIFVGRFVDEAAARAGGGLENDWYARTGTTDFYKLNASTETQIYRAGRKEFPKISLIIAESDRVVIYDLTTNEPSMWMVFVGAAYGFGLNVVDLTCLSIKESILTFGTVATLSVASFSNDYCDVLTSTGTFRSIGSFENRNTVQTQWSGTDNTKIIINSVVNDVAMVVLPDAPIDSVTGLKVPTIAVATDGGISVITDSGDVYDSSTTTAQVSLSFAKDNSLVCILDTGISNLPYRIYYPTSYTATSFSHDFYLYQSDSGVASVTPNTLGHPLTVERYFSGSSIGLTHLNENANSAIDNDLSMTAYTTKDYATGWMVGDIKGCLLADSNVGSIVGTELVTNGDFPSTTTGWTAGSGATLSVDTARLKILGDTTNYPYANQQITTVVGETYVLSGEAITGSLSIGTIAAGTSTSGGEYGHAVLSSVGIGGLTFIATTTTTHISCQISSTVDNSHMFFDNISCRLAVEDRSVKNNGAQVFGTITKALIDTNSELVAFSGFSASNYLEQPYNADLDFGTGDFCFGYWLKQGANTVVEHHFVRGYYSGSFSGAIIYSRTSTDGTILIAISDDGLVTSDTISSTNTIDDGVDHFIEVYRTGSLVYLLVDGVSWGSVTLSNAVGSLSNASASLMIGSRQDSISPLTNGSIALFRASATLPTAKQRDHIYETERQMIKNSCLLDGDSNAITALNFNEKRNLLSVGTSWGRTDFNNLVRVDSEATGVGSLTAIAYDGDLILNGGASGSDILIPEIDLRVELIGTKLEVAEDDEWVDVTFENGWLNYNAASFSTAQYRKIGDVVYLKGFIKSGTIAQPAFTLPVGFRAMRDTYFATTAQGAFGQVIVELTGIVRPSIGSTVWLSLDGINFTVS